MERQLRLLGQQEGPDVLIRTMPRNARGFTLIELLVTLTLLGFLLALGLPAFTTMVRNTQIRTVADALQNGIRLARAEALRYNQSTVFILTTAAPALNVAAAANGNNWWVQTIPHASGEAASGVQGGALGDVASGVTITGPAAICFNSNGRPSSIAAPGPSGAACSMSSTTPVATYDVAQSNADRALRVTVSIGGQVRLCDPKRAITSAPDGC